MSQANDLLNSLPVPESVEIEEPHIVINEDRIITVPNKLKRLGVQHDHNVETVTFDCPRFWDGLDMSQMTVYINYMLSNREKAAYIAQNVTAEENIMHFTWTISSNVTQHQGQIAFLVCVKKTGEGEDGEPVEINHWNSELCTECYISEGMECEVELSMEYPDIVTQLLERMYVVEQAKDTMHEYLLEAREAMDLAEGAATAASGFKDVAEMVRNQVVNEGDYIRNAYAPALKGNVSGEIIQVDDVSPIQHDVKCWVHGKNLFDISKISTTSDTSTAHISEVGADYIIVTTPDGYTGNGYCTISTKLKDVCPGLEVGKTYVLNAGTESEYKNIYFAGIKNSWLFGEPIVMTDDLLNSIMTFYGFYGATKVGDCRISNIQIEEGSVATEYEPYIDPTTVTVTGCGKNLIPSSDGKCRVPSVYPTMTIFTDTPGVTIEVEYNKETKKAITEDVDTILKQKCVEMSAEEYASAAKDDNTYYFVY